MSYALIAVLMVSCASDSEEQIVQNPNGFTDSDLTEIQAFKNFSEKSLNKMRPVAVNAIKRNRANTRGGVDELNSGEMAAISQNLAAVGKETVSLLKNMGADMNELNQILPFENNRELYGMVGLEIADALDPTDITLYDGPDGCEIAIKIDKAKVLSCLLKTFGLSDAWDFLYRFTSRTTAGYATKAVIIETLKLIAKEAAAKGAKVLSCGYITIALFVAEWATCYFDVPLFSSIDFSMLNALEPEYTFGVA